LNSLVAEELVVVVVVVVVVAAIDHEFQFTMQGQES
jgi:hypothetical protein